ncbi:MAG TPA: HAMP domain-containing sensor histidine kinase [Allosphingosinicella sp.]|nr:HAMP domain-containing sensor histidine kinase [Allosphingosinicella sp.]
MAASLKLLQTSTFRLVALYLFIFALSVGAILSYVYLNTVVLIERQGEETVEAELRNLAEEYRSGGLDGLTDAVRRRSDQSSGAIYLLTNFLGRRLAGNLDGLPQRALKGEGWIEFTYGVESFRGLERHQARAYHLQLPNGAVLIVGRDVEEKRQFADLIRRSLYLALAIAVVLGLLGGMLMSRNFLRRVETITATSRSIMAGDLSQRVPVSGSGDELDRLSVGLNLMLDQIERLMAGMKEISSNVAHDLRTPLTRLRTRLESALRSTDGDHRKALEAAIREADSLLATFAALLSIARTEAGQVREGLRPVELKDFVNEIGELFAPLAEESGGSLVVKADGPVTVSADRQLLAQAVSNLVDNALKYGVGAGRSGPDITLELVPGERTATLAVSDRGPGVAAADRSRIAERFVRLDASRTKPGSGLGLSLVQGIAHLHRGELVIDDNAPGLRVALVLPRHVDGD